MSDFKNSIQLGIKIDPQNQSQTDLKNIINKLNENKINIDLNIKGDASKQLESLSVLIDTIKSKMGGEISLGNLDKVINNSITGLTKLNGELQKVSQTNFSDGNKKVITETATALGEVVSQTQKFDKNNNVMGDGISRTTTNLIAQQKALQEVAEAQERLNSLTLADNNKVANLKNVFTNISENNGKGYSDNQLSDYLNQVKQLEIEENRLISVKQKETELNTKLNNAEYISSQKSAYKQLFDLQNEEYILKEKLLTAEGKYKEQLESRLVTINQLKQSQQQNIQGNNLTNQQKELELTNQQIVKQEHLNQLRSKIDTQNNSKFISDLQKQNEYLDKSIAKLNQYKQAINTHATNMGGDSTAQSQTISKIDEQITKINQLKESNSLLGNVEKNRINESINGLKQETSALTTHQHSFTDMIKSMAMMATSGALLYGALNKIKDAVQYIIGVENAMIDLRRVVDMNDETAQSFQNSMHNISVQLASTNADTISTVATFAKLGYSIQDATKLGEITTKYNFAADINDINSAATSLIATLKGFGLEANNAVRVTDEINQVSNKFAVTATDVNTVLAKSSATMSTFGNTLEESIALGTTANEIMRNASTVGNALKSIAPRLTTNKNALEQLDAFNIKLEDSQGNLKSTYAIFKELSNSMKNLKGEDLAKASNNLFGKQNISTGLAIVKNIEQLDKVMKTLKDSTGSVDQEFNRYLNSTQAKVTQLKENLGGLYSLFLNSTMTKGAVGGLNSFVTAITSVISKMGSLPSVITTVVGALTIFNQRFKTAMTAYQPSFVTNWNKSFTGLKDALSDVANRTMDNITATRKLIVAKNEEGASTLSAKAKLAGYQVQLGAVTIAEKACAISAEALGVAFNMVLGLGIGLAIQAITSFIGKSEELKQQNQELLSSIQTLGSDSASLEELKNKYTTLREEIDKGGLSARDAKAKKQELSGVYDELIQKSPELKKLLDLESGSYKDQIDAIQGVIDKKNEEAGLKAEQYVRDNKVSDSGVEDKIKELTRLQEELKVVEKNLDRDDLTESQRKNTQDYITNLKTDISGLKTSLSEISNVQDTLNKLNIKNGISSDELEKVKSVVSSIKLYNSAIDDNTDKTNQNTNAKEKNNSVDTGDIENEVNAEQEKADAIKNATEEYQKSTQAIAKAQSFIDKLNKESAVTPTIAGQISKTYKDMTTDINDVGSTIDFLKGKIKEQQEAQENALMIMKGDDADFYKEKVANNEDYESQINDFLARFTGNSKNAYDVDLSQFTTLNQMKAGVQDSLKSAVDGFMKDFVDINSAGYKVDYQNFTTLISAKKEVMKQIAGALADYWDEGSQEFGAEGYGGGTYLPDNASDATYKAYEDKINKIAGIRDKVKDAEKKLDSIYAGGGLNFKGFVGGGSDFSGTGGGSGSKGKSGGGSGKSQEEKDVEKAQKEADEWKKKIDDLNSDTIKPDPYYEVNNTITQLDNSMKALKTSEDGLTGNDLVQAKQKEIDVMNKQINAQKSLQALQEIERDNLKSTLSQYGILTDETGNLTNAQEKLNQMQAEANAISGSSEVEYEVKKKAIDQVKQLSDQVSKYNDLVNKTLPETIDKWNELSNSIKKANEEAKKASEDTINATGEKLVEALKQEYEKKKTAELKSLKDEYDDDVKDLQDEIDKLQKKLDGLNDESTDNQTKLAKLKAERQLWLNETNNVFAKSKVTALDSQISDLEKTIQKDSLQKQIDDLNKEKSTREDSYNKQVQATEDLYNDLEDEHKLYNKATEILTTKNTKRIKELLSSQDESFKEIGTKLGQALNDPIQQEVNDSITAINNLIDKINELNEAKGEKSSSKSSSSKSSKGDNTETTSNSDKTKTYSNGDYEDSKGYYHHVATYDTGGRTPSNIDDGAIGVLHSDEKILNKNDTVMIDEIYDYIKSSGSLITQMSNPYSNNASYTIPNLSTNLSSIDNNLINNNTDNSNYSPVQMAVNIVNHNGAEAVMNEKTLEKMVNKVVQKSATKFGGKGFTNR